MPDPAVDLTTVADVKDVLGIPVSETSQDSRLDRLVTAASRRIATFCDRRFISETYTEFQHGRRTNTLILKHWPAVKPTELNEDADSVFPASSQIASDEYDILDDQFVVLLSGRRFRPGTRSIKIVYTAGYTTANIPEDLKDNANWLVEHLFNMTSDRRVGIVSKSKSGESISYITDDLPPLVKQGLMPYKRPFEWGLNVAVQNR